MNEDSANTDLLIQFLDGELDGEPLMALQQLLDKSPSVRDELESLRLTREAVKSYGLKMRIGSIHAEVMSDLKKSEIQIPGLVRTIFRYGLRVAAVLIILLGISSIYQYYTATPEKLFDENFKAAEIHELRGAQNNTLEDLYEKGDMNGLIGKFSQMPSPIVKDYFLAGNAYLSLHHPAKAIQAFISLDSLNKVNNTHYYEEDAEYFLALSYLANQQPSIALPLFQKIHSDPNHPFHTAINGWFLAKVRRTAHI